MPSSVPVPVDSLLGAYAQNGAFTDCYATSVSAPITLREFIEAFYTTRLFKLERWLIAQALRIPSTDEQAAQFADAQSRRFSAWHVENRAGHEILVGAWKTRSWLCVIPSSGGAPSTTLLFGSAVVPARPDGTFGLTFHMLGGFHRLYSKMLLSAAVRRVLRLRELRDAV